MNLRDLKYLVTLAEHRHFGKAAALCFVSQPTLSMQIKKLEQELGIPLLERNNKSVRLTEMGDKVLVQAREILQRVAQIGEIARIAEDPYAGELKIGIIPTLAPYFLPHIISPLKREFPRLALYLYEAQTAHMLARLREGALDAGILALPVKEPELTVTQLFNEQFLLAVPKDHLLADKKMIKQSALAGKKLLLLEEGHCLRDQALAFCKQPQTVENSSFQATSLETLRHMVAAGMGITLIPELAYQVTDNVSYVAFTPPAPARTIGMLWRNSNVKIPLLSAVAALISEQCGTFKKLPSPAQLATVIPEAR